MRFLWMCLDSGCVSLCQGGPSRSNLQAGGHLQSKLYGLSWQDQCGPSCYCPGSDGTTGVIFWIFFVYDNLYFRNPDYLKKKKGHNHYKYQGLHFMCAFLPAAEEIGCDASRAASASQVLQDLSGHVGKQRWHHQQTVRWHSSSQGILIVWGLG